jgi:signal transduction histidine kinase
MTLTQQFLIIAVLPASFLMLALFLLRARLRRRALAGRWLLTLLAAAVWASSLLVPYGGADWPLSVGYTWQVIGSYSLGLVAIGALWTTVTFLALPRAAGQAALTLSVILWLAAVGLDPAIWRYTIPAQLIAGRTVHHFDLWGAVWVTSVLLPLVTAWYFSQRAVRYSLSSLHRNQLSYWLLALTLFLLGAGLAFNREVGWQELAALVLILGGLFGTLSVTRSKLPDLRMGMRQFSARLVSALVIFGLAWVALWFMAQAVNNSPAPTQNLIVLFAAIFAALFEVVHYLLWVVTRRLFLPASADPAATLSDYTDLTGSLLEPMELSELILKQVQMHLGTEDAWMLLAEEGPGGRLAFRPLANLTNKKLGVVDFGPFSPFTTYLRDHFQPFIQYDLERLEEFENLSEWEQKILAEWQRVVYMPFQAGGRLVGLLGLGPKLGSEPYSNDDMRLLKELATHLSPLLAQASIVTNLRRISDYAFQQSQALVQETRHQAELISLYNEFFKLISPELRRPFTLIDREIQQLQDKLAEQPTQRHVANLEQQLTMVRTVLNNLIGVAGRVERQSGFSLHTVHLDEVARHALRNLAPMAEARRVTVDLVVDNRLPLAYGDEQRLGEAVQNLLHNAIKFNKIGGGVRMECGTAGNELFLNIVDDGVGIPAERLEHIWNGFSDANSMNSSSKGPGMGLALTRFIVRAHGGRVEANSKYGAGSTFSIYLPIGLEEAG